MELPVWKINKRGIRDASCVIISDIVMAARKGARVWDCGDWGREKGGGKMMRLFRRDKGSSIKRELQKRPSVDDVYHEDWRISKFFLTHTSHPFVKCAQKMEGGNFSPRCFILGAKTRRTGEQTSEFSTAARERSWGEQVLEFYTRKFKKLLKSSMKHCPTENPGSSLFHLQHSVHCIGRGRVHIEDGLTSSHQDSISMTI